MALRFRIAIAAVLAALSLLAAATELRIGMGADVTSMDPHFVNLGPNNNIAEHVFEKLVTLDADSRLIPALAISWRAVDATTWEFRLRKGVRFHDGTEFTAQDVAFSIDRVGTITNSPAPFSPYTRPIRQVLIVDPHTIRFVTASAYPLVPNDLSTIYIVSKKAASGASTEDFDAGRAMIGTGPFKFVRFVRGDRVESARNDDYWGPKPAWDKVTFRILPSDPARLAALLSGDVQAIENIPTADLPRLRANRDIRIYQKVSHRIIFLHLDQLRDRTPYITDKSGRPLPQNPLKDLRVRRAISKAINRQAIRDRVMEGMSVPSANLVPSPMFGHNPDLKPDAFDPEGAKKLLAEAGYAAGFRLTIHGPNNRYVNDDQILQALAGMLTRIGIETRVEALPMNVYISRASKLEFSVALIGWGASTAEVSSPLRSHLATEDRDRGMGAYNWSRYSNSRLDALLEEALHTVNDGRRERLLREAVAIGIGDLGVIPIHHQINTWATRNGIVYVPRIDEYTLAQFFRPQ